MKSHRDDPFWTKRFGCAACVSCITRSHGLDSFLFQTCLVRSGAKMVHLFRWFTLHWTANPWEQNWLSSSWSHFARNPNAM